MAVTIISSEHYVIRKAGNKIATTFLKSLDKRFYLLIILTMTKNNFLQTRRHST